MPGARCQRWYALYPQRLDADCQSRDSDCARDDGCVMPTMTMGGEIASAPTGGSVGAGYSGTSLATWRYLSF